MSTQRVDAVQQTRTQAKSIPGLFSHIDSWSAKDGSETAPSPLRESATIRDILTNSDPNDVAQIESCEEPALREIISKDRIVSARASRIILDAALYYENIGNFGKSIALVTDVVDYASAQKDFLLQRRAHSVLGALYSRVSDFEAAFLHSEIACSFARETQRPEEIIPAFSNAALILYSAGLTTDAQSISFAISRFPLGNLSLNNVHLINSNNGIRLSHQIGDYEAASFFFARSRRLFKQQDRYLTGVSRAYYEAFTAEHQILTGKANLAIGRLEKALERTSINTNARVFSLLSCALARGYLASGNLKELASSKKRLVSLLSVRQLQSYHQEEILTILIDIVALEDNQSSEKSFFLRQLRTLLVDTKYKQFFSNIAKSYATGTPRRSLGQPTHSVPVWVKDVVDEVTATPFNVKVRLPVLDGVRPVSLSKITAESRLRSPQYEVAEDWAVAAELLNGGDGQYCFGVGEIVRAIACQLGIDSQRAGQMGLAARLHDIGSIATVRAVYEGVRAVPLGDFGATCLHCEVGEKLLGEVSQPVLQIAARIAAAHHEWWNGHGLPRGLRGESIPLEARLCAAADIYLSLRKPKSGAPWSAASAIDQIKSMAGVQLDPYIARALIDIVEAPDQIPRKAAELQANRNSLLRAKKALFTTLELN